MNEMYRHFLKLIPDWLKDGGNFDVVIRLVDGTSYAIDAKKFWENECGDTDNGYVTVNFTENSNRIAFVPFDKIVAMELREGEAPKLSSQDELIRKTRNVRLRDLDLTIRALNVLHAMDIDSVDKLLRCTERFLFSTRNMGRKSLYQIEECLDKMGYKLGMLPPYWVDVYGTSALMSDNSWKRFRTTEEAEHFIETENAKIFSSESKEK